MKELLKVVVLTLLATVMNTSTSLSVDISQVTIIEDQSVAEKFQRYTLTGIRTPLPQLPDVPGFIGVTGDWCN